MESVARLVAVALPEALVLPLPETGGDIAPSAADLVLELAGDAAAVLIGPGARNIDQCRTLLDSVLPELAVPLVLDAAGIAYVDGELTGLRHLGGRAVLTPNRKELALALDVDNKEVEADPAGMTLRLAQATQTTVVCGGAESWIASPDGRLWCDQTGGYGLAVSGSGDVFAGIVAGLTARGAGPEQAAVWASQLHGRAGDRLAAAVGRVGYLAREIPAEVPRALAEIEI